jgi:O-antigen/teichoic acid export membrane protein
LPYSLSVFGVQIFQFSATNLRPLILSVRAGISPFADYRILNGFATTIMSMSVGFVGILLPMATKAVALGNKPSRDKIAYQGTKYLTIFLSLVVFGFVLISRDLLCIYVGDKYAYLDMWLKLWVLTMLFSHNSAISSLVFAENRLMPVVIISAFSATTSLVIAWYLVPHYQVGGIILSYLYYCISQITFYYSYYYRKVLKLDVGHILLRSFFTPAALIGACAAVAWYTISFLSLYSRTGRILSTAFVFTLCSSAVVFFVLLNADDKTFIKNLLTRRKQASGVV